MNVSKVKLVLKYMTGGIAGVIEYLLDLFNAMIDKLPKDEVAKYAQLASDISNFIKNLCSSLITDAEKKDAALKTAEAFNELAIALLDAEVTPTELDAITEKIAAAVEAWRY